MTTATVSETMLDLATHNAIITLTSPKTGEHRTFKVHTIQGGVLDGRRMISLLVGQDNESDYSGFGFIREDGTIAVWGKHRGTQFERFADLFDRAEYWAGRGVEYLAEGRCRRCNRLLTHPTSISTGIGPECAKRA
jgi:uncharacterized protein DUF6011